MEPLTTLHSVSFRPSSLGKFAVHPLPLLCSPALSSGLRAVMLFALHLFFPFGEMKEELQKITPALVRCTPIAFTHVRASGFPHSSLPHSLRTSVHAPCSHPTSCSRTHFGETPSFALAARNPAEAIALLTRNGVTN